MLQVDSATQQILNANEAAIKFYGYSKKELLQKTVHDLNELPPAEIKKLMKAAVKKESNFFQFKHKLANNLIKDVEVYASPFTICDKTIMYITIYDITNRKKNEGKLLTKNKELIKAKEKSEEIENKYTILFNSASIGILIADTKKMKLSFANPAICKMLGYTEEELRRMNVMDIHPKNSIDLVISEFQAQAKKEKTLVTNLPCLKKDGSIIYTNVNTTSFTINEIEYNVGFFTDITEKRESEIKIKKQNDEYASLNEEYLTQNEELRKIIQKAEASEKNYKRIIENLTDMYYRADENGKMVMASPSCMRVFGYSSMDEIIGKSVDVIYPDPNDRKKFNELPRGRASKYQKSVN